MDKLDPKAMRDIPDPFADEAGGAPGALDMSTLPPAPTRARVQVMRAIAAAGAVGFQIAWLVVMGLRSDLASIPTWVLAAGLAAPLAAAAMAMSACMAGERGLGRPLRSIASLLVAAPVVFAVGTLYAPAAIPPTSSPSTKQCLVVTALLTMGPLIALLLAFRRAFATSSRWRTAAIGVTCGALAATTVKLACINDLHGHVLVGHGAFLIVGGLAGWVGARFTRA